MVESKMNRRQFFKTLAATAAGVAAVGVVPRVVGASDMSVVIANGIDCGAPLRWEKYYKDYPELDQEQIKEFEAAADIWAATLKNI